MEIQKPDRVSTDDLVAAALTEARILGNRRWRGPARRPAGERPRTWSCDDEQDHNPNRPRQKREHSQVIAHSRHFSHCGMLPRDAAAWFASRAFTRLLQS